MDLKLLREPHKFQNGDPVVVRERRFSNKSYCGTIYNIVSQPLNKHAKEKNYIEVDYFYIKFDEDVYHQILRRGWEVYYKNYFAILGDVVYCDKIGKIEKLYTQQTFGMGETEINISDINAILIWRVGFEILPDKNRYNVYQSDDKNLESTT
jgi:hypothetical protein